MWVAALVKMRSSEVLSFMKVTKTFLRSEGGVAVLRGEYCSKQDLNSVVYALLPRHRVGSRR